MLNKVVFVFFLGFFLLPFFSVGAETGDTLGIVAEGEAQAEYLQEGTTTIYFFDDRFCSVCQEAKSFLISVLDDYDNFEIEIISITETARIQEVATKAGIEEYRIMSPMIFIGNKLFQFNYFGQSQEEILISVLEGLDYTSDEDRYTFGIPFTQKEIVVKDWSLPFLTVVLGTLDGFNICSLGALILILTLVMTLNSRKLIFIYGGLFIFTAVLIYGTLVFVWGQLFNALVGHLLIFRYIVGVSSFAGAIYFFKEFWRFYRYGPTCQSSESALAQKATSKILTVFKDPNRKPIMLASAIVAFATIITIVELPCSIGVPIAFTGILVEKGLSLGAYTGYILLYLFFYMLIEMIVFSGAVMSKKLWFANSKMVTWVTFAGALVLIYISFYYFFG